MERGARKERGCRESDTWADNATMLYGSGELVDVRNRYWSMGSKPYQRNRGSASGIHSNRVYKMNAIIQRATDILCYFILAFCFCASFFTGAYNHVMRDIAMESLLSMSIASLSNVEVVA